MRLEVRRIRGVIGAINADGAVIVGVVVVFVEIGLLDVLAVTVC